MRLPTWLQLARASGSGRQITSSQVIFNPVDNPVQRRAAPIAPADGSTETPVLEARAFRSASAASEPSSTSTSGSSPGSSRAHRAERRRQDDLHRRDLGLRPLPRQRPARRPRPGREGAARAGAAGSRPHVAVGRAVRRPDGATRTSRSPRSTPRRGRLCGKSSPRGRPRAASRSRRRSASSGSKGEARRCRSELSQADRKLVGVARALAAAPRLLCLDEPAAGLDAVESEALGRHLREIVDRGTATLLVDHDMGLVLSISDYVVVLEFGKVIAQGTPDARPPRPARRQRVPRQRGKGSDRRARRSLVTGQVRVARQLPGA